MKYISFDEPQRIHFIGIGGISMSGLAEVLKSNGFTVSGSDMRASKITNHLKEVGMHVTISHRAGVITSDLDLVVYTAAISKDNPEYLKALELNIPTIDRATLLGEIMANYRHSIGVAGTHGKTTTTSMLANILLSAEKDPTISVGGLLDAIDGNIKIGNSSYFLTEACEYTNSFLKFYPQVGVILNVEEDHMDFFKDLEDIQNSFNTYARQIDTDGYLIINNQIKDLDRITKDVTCKVITCDVENNNADYYATNITYHNNIYPEFDIMRGDSLLGHLRLNVTGIHNVHNAVCAYAASDCLNISFDQIAKGLYNFKGAKRRFEYKGDMHGITIIDDYAHHPTEIEVNLKVLKQYPHNKLWCVFQPHTYTRTKAFLPEFAKALSLSDYIVLADIYAAREKNTGNIHSKDIIPLLNSYGKDAYYFPSFDEIENFLLENVSPGDLLITMGAGDIYIVGEELLGM